MKKDNDSFQVKLQLRQRAMQRLREPVVMETHAGLGKLGGICYADVPFGIAIELRREKASVLAMRRPTWAIYAGDSAAALVDGLAADVPVTLLDVDPYGEPWPTIRAFFRSERVFAPELTVVVNDGLRRRIKMTGGWSTASLHEAVEQFGSDLHDHYLEVCRWLMTREARQAGYDLTGFAGLYAGHTRQMTHYEATLRRSG